MSKFNQETNILLVFTNEPFFSKMHIKICSIWNTSCVKLQCLVEGKRKVTVADKHSYANVLLWEGTEQG